MPAAPRAASGGSAQEIVVGLSNNDTGRHPVYVDTSGTRLLIASPDAPAHIARCVVLVAVHGQDGSLGFRVDQPLSLSMRESLQTLGVDVPRAIGSACRGGEVHKDAAWLLFDGSTGAPADSCKLAPSIHVTASIDAAHELLSARSVPRALLCRGHRTWEAGELEAELSAGYWLTVDLDAGLLFDVPFERRWSEALCAVLGVAQPWLGHGHIANA